MAAFIVNGMPAFALTSIWESGFELNGGANNGLATWNKSEQANYRKSIREANGAASDPGQAWGGDMRSNPFRVAVREAVLGFAVQREANQTGELSVGFQNGTAGVLTRMRSQGDIISLRRAGSAELANIGFFDLGTSYTYFFLHSFHDQTQGFVRLYAHSFEADRMLGEGTGDTSDQANVYAAHFYTDALTTVINYGAAFDDVVVYARTLFASALSGTAPAQGQTVTGGASGATAVIDQVEFDDADPTKAVLYLAQVTGDFAAGEALTFSGTGTATAENAHPEDIHGLAKPVFIRYRVPASDVQSNWTRSAGAATDYEAINDRLSDNGEYLEATAAALVNEHGLEAAPAGLYAGAVFVRPMAVAEQDSGGVGSIHLALRSGATVSNGDSIPVPGSAGLVVAGAAMRDPDTGDEWSVEAADAATLLLESAP